MLSDIFRRVFEKNAEDTIANTALTLFDLDRDGFVTIEEFKQVPCKLLSLNALQNLEYYLAFLCLIC